MQPRELQRFQLLHRKVLDYVRRECEDGAAHKSYEGTMSLNITLPDAFDSDRSPYYRLTLDCYLLCPGRHAVWKGKDLDKVLDTAERQIAAWISGDYETEEHHT